MSDASIRVMTLLDDLEETLAIKNTKRFRTGEEQL